MSCPIAAYSNGGWLQDSETTSCEDEWNNGGRLNFWAELPAKKIGLLGPAKADFQTNAGAAKEMEVDRRDLVSVQPDPHLDEIFTEQDFRWLFDVHNRCWRCHIRPSFANRREREGLSVKHRACSARRQSGYNADHSHAASGQNCSPVGEFNRARIGVNFSNVGYRVFLRPVSEQF
jgi:hypothetical protein